MPAFIEGNAGSDATGMVSRNLLSSTYGRVWLRYDTRCLKPQQPVPSGTAIVRGSPNELGPSKRTPRRFHTP